MITITGCGFLRNNILEVVRALEIAQLILFIQPSVEWKLQYGEIEILGKRVDGIMQIKDKDNLERIGIEVISEEKSIEKIQNKLYQLIELNEINKGYIYLRPLLDVQNGMIGKLKLFKEVKLR
jgi:hypothetical protein